ncbi:hypothetical protein HanRHA438_Chr03g0122351 [Helianthus annuus]|uniref:Organ specific protein n=1 Tax=Helianthus annuus TaxID=4232 RepID=A0A251U397_HELAN|nr:hypothetical protein HanXRQr2_Chr03g0110081 [Helianthus annuus]KAJ0592976.1 hypothetical protein HanHA300_Chr03g0091891 [Helianthus annuus]KAJ0600723.1 hypothetical protein HanIR_Chr03g0120411 [Helianthus annuus]KAJ0607991.1 hypothetical protein HanHA89_Chr03g0103661 [Helianthus annuus]KAJ0768055.1 hypothetical protein HanLR1_Chr03g0097021 [Helianthus annuus]
MRSLSVFLVFFSLILLASIHEARKDPKDWRNAMKYEPIPPDALSQDSTTLNDKENNKDQFVRDFDKQPNLKMFAKGFNPKPSSLVSNGCPPKQD